MGCGTTSQNTETNASIEILQETNEKSLNDLMLVFKGRMDTYLANGEKDLKALEQIHLSFVPILGWAEFKGDANYKKSALSVGSIVHQLEDLEGNEYAELLDTLKPAYVKFHNEYGE